MKSLFLHFLGALLLTALTLVFAGCLTGNHGYPSDHGVYYGAQRDPWFRDDAWIDDHGIPAGSRREPDPSAYIHPPARRW